MGAAMQWLHDQLGIISDAAEVATSARQVEENGRLRNCPAAHRRWTALRPSHHSPPLPGACHPAAQGYPSLYAHLRQEGYSDGYWTVGGLTHLLGVARRWVQWQITTGRLPAQQHPLTKHHLIPDDPELIAHLRTQIPTHTLT